MRFNLVDQIIEQGDDRIVTAKNVTAAEEYLGDHFPTFPVLPGVMMLESLVQAARVLLAADAEEGGSAAPATRGRGPWVLAAVRNVRYGNMVRPGEQLRVTVERKKTDGDVVRFTGVGEVNGAVAVQGKFEMRPVRRTAE